MSLTRGYQVWFLAVLSFSDFSILNLSGSLGVVHTAASPRTKRSSSMKAHKAKQE
jgi:hypothetical protein